jgi:hypothetical protein
MKLLLSTIAAAILTGALFAAPAEARCWFNGRGWQCSHPAPHHQPQRFPAPWLGY